MWALALFPGALFFSAVYSEALYLALSVGCVLRARTGRWAWAGALGALGAATRSAGVVLVVPLAVMWLAQADGGRAASRDAAWIALVPAGLAAFCGALALGGGDAFAPFHAQDIWYRHFAGPFVGVWDGTAAAWRGLHDLGAPAARADVVLFGFLVATVPMVIGGAPAPAGRVRRVRARRARAAAVVAGRPAAADVAAALRRGAVPAVHVARRVARRGLAAAPRRGPRAVGRRARDRQRGRLDLALVRVKAALLDALGTLVELERPWPHLVAELRARGVAVSEDDARRAMLAEMAYYRATTTTRRDFAGLDGPAPALRGHRARASSGTALPVGDVEDALLAAIRFRPYPEVPGVLAALGARGVARVVVSNWDVSLHDVLERTRLRPLLDAVVTSAEFGAAKPDPSIFHHALALAGATPAEAVHAGDDVEADVEGARAAGIAAVLVARDGMAAPPGVRTVRTLEALLAG